MDRWQDADDDIRASRQHTVVPRQGFGGFVKSSSSTEAGKAPAAQGSKLEVVASRKEQKAAQAAAKVQPKEIIPGFAAPAWLAASPPPHAVLRCEKDNKVVQEVPLVQAATVFGRHADAMVHLDHASVSRFHAALCFEAGSGKCKVIDFGSAHGTFIAGKRCVKGQPHDLPVGVELRFAASTRAYFLHLKDGEQPASKRPRLRFADEGDNSKASLEQVIGYSDGKDFAAKVGPKAAADGGKFAAVVDTRVLPANVSPSPHSQPSSDKAAVKQELKSFVDDIRKRNAGLLVSGLFGDLPQPHEAKKC